MTGPSTYYLTRMANHRCSKCEELKDESDFSPNGTRPDGSVRPKSVCKACVNASQRLDPDEKDERKRKRQQKQYEKLQREADARRRNPPTRGRPPEYHGMMIDILDATEGDAMGAGTMTDIAKILGCAHGTVYDWMHKHPDFAEAVLRVRERADELVVSAMRKRATGYSIENPVKVKEQTTRWVKASDLYDLEQLTDLGYEPDDDIEVEVRDVKERETMQHTHIPADPNAAKFWLSNRQRKDWTERKEVEIKGDFATMVEQFHRELNSDEGDK